MEVHGRDEVRPLLASYAEFFAGLPRAALILDPTGRIVHANPAAQSLLSPGGKPPLMGRRYDDPGLFGGPETRMRAIDEAGTPVEPGPPHPVELALTSGEPVRAAHLVVDGARAGRLYLSADVIPLHSGLGGVAGVGVVYTNDTEEVARRSESEWLRRELVTARQRVEENLRLSDSLGSIGEAIHETLDFDELLMRLLTDATEAIGAKAGLIEVKEAGSWIPRAVFGLPREILGRHFSPAEARHASIVEETAEPIAVPDTFEDERFENDVVRGLSMRALLSVPLISRKKVVATLSFYNPQRTDFSYDQVSFASKVATTASLAMENARVYGEERHIADTLQRALLVVPEAIEGIAFEHLYRSATEAAWVGGDFFDIFELPGERVGIVIGDVSGKGIEASALASFTRQLLKAHASEGISPADVLARTNELVRLVSLPQDFVTVFLGILSLADGCLTFSSAGHPPPVLSNLGGSRLLYDGGPILGAFDGVEYHEQDVWVERGDLLVLYTDGVIEAKRGGELFGDERLVQLIDSLALTDLRDFPEAMLREVSTFAKGQLRDDVAILCLRRPAQE